MISRRDEKLVSRFARFAAIVFALLQIIAPTFHVCGLGGASASTRGVVMTCHGAVSLQNASDSEVQAMRVAYRLFSFDTLPAASPERSAVCLAQLLNTMGGETAPKPSLRVAFSSRVLAPIFAAPFVSRGATPQPPARGPPILSV